MFLSFIIPAYNEARFIERCIRSIQSNVGGVYEHEIILIDNASTDQTAAIAESLGVEVLKKDRKYTISAVRNAGVKASRGDILIFIDGDVYLHDSWIEHVPPVLKRLQEEDWVAGSVYAVDPDASWIPKVWFQPWFDQQEQVSFINGGHLLMTRELFDRIGGFDESMETGEDHEICERARAAGAEISNLPELMAVHLGYPNSLGHFFRRERWHGKGNFSPIKRIFASRIPLFVLMILASFLVSVVAPIVTGNLWYLLVYPLFAGAASAAAALKWLGGFQKSLLPCMFLSWLYFTARTFSIWEVFKESMPGSKKAQT